MDCTKCSICRSRCLVERLGGASITSVLNEAAEKGAWNCSNCWKCIDACPQEFDIYNAIIEKRRLEEAPRAYREAFAGICRNGYIFPIEELNTIREMWGLNKIELVGPEVIRKLIKEC